MHRCCPVASPSNKLSGLSAWLGSEINGTPVDFPVTVAGWVLAAAPANLLGRFSFGVCSLASFFGFLQRPLGGRGQVVKRATGMTLPRFILCWFMQAGIGRIACIAAHWSLVPSVH